MPHDQYIPKPESGVQHLGHDEIAERIAMHAQRIAAAERTLLESHAEIAKMLLMLNEYHGYAGRRYVNFAKAHGIKSRTDAYDLLRLASVADEIVAVHEHATQDDPGHEWPS